MKKSGRSGRLQYRNYHDCIYNVISSLHLEKMLTEETSRFSPWVRW